MNKPFHLSLILKNLLRRTNDNISRLQNSINQAPEGSIEVRKRRGKNLFFRYVNNQPEEYLGEDKKELISALIQKKLDLEFLKIDKKEKHVIEQALKALGPKTKEKVWKEFPQELKAFVRVDKSVNAGHIQQWLSQGPLTAQDEEHMFLTEKGDYVRSKSEYIIANRLNKKGIPYHYEQKLAFEHGFLRYYPDFTILKPTTLETYYWEHFGMMDDEKYFTSTKKKLDIYAEYDIFPGTNLILTFETAQSPLTVEHIDRQIKKFLL